MTKWRLLVVICSLALLCWGIYAAIEYSQAEGATDDLYAGCFFSSFGLAGLVTLFMPRFGYLAAVVHLAAAAYGLWWFIMTIVLSRAALMMPLLQTVSPLILMVAGTMVLLCGGNALGTWQIARRTRAPHPARLA